MNRGIFILLLLVLAVAGWTCGYLWGGPDKLYWLRSSNPGSSIHAAHGGGEDSDMDLEWLRREFRLTPEQFDAVRRLHQDYEPRCAAMCDRIVQSRRRIKDVLSRKLEVDAEVELAVRESAEVWQECQLAMLRHIRNVGQAMDPEQGTRYITLMERHLPIFDAQDSPAMKKETGKPVPSGTHP
ncbi:hypothetical protein DB346_23410 [Verrucomicrobia bacterium LW23]|nr:hypothetical protein DB346_23410 [Verrucomicrobia bacterium LW23]